MNLTQPQRSALQRLRELTAKQVASIEANIDANLALVTEVNGGVRPTASRWVSFTAIDRIMRVMTLRVLVRVGAVEERSTDGFGREYRVK